MLFQPNQELMSLLTANPSVSSVVGGLITYSYQVFYSGSGSLANIALVDDKCSSVIYTGGDTNNDTRLDKDEVWKYIC